MELALLICSMLLVFAGAGLTFIGLFRPAPEAEVDAAFRISIDNIHRETIFDIPELRPALWPFIQISRRIGIDRLRRRVLQNLRASGNPKAYSPDEYLTLCVLTGIGLAVATVIFQGFVLGAGVSLLSAPVAFVIGFWLCDIRLAVRAEKRLRKINRRLPYALDLLAMTMKAGATFYEAARTVSQEDPDDPLSEELQTIVREIEFGRSRQEALEHFAERIPLDTLSSIIAAILQAERLGTPLAKVLELQASLLRMRRSMRAEKSLGEATVKLLIPVTFIFVAVILILFGPMIVRFARGDIWG